MVQHREGLLRQDADGPFVAFLEVGRIELAEEVDSNAPRRSEVETSSGARLRVARSFAGAAQPIVETAGQREQGVPEDLRLHPPGRKSPEAAVIGIQTKVEFALGTRR